MDYSFISNSNQLDKGELNLQYIVIAFIICAIPFFIGIFVKKKDEKLGGLIMIVSVMILIAMEQMIIRR